MYNRYIPQADGSYRRSRIPDNSPKPPPPPPSPVSHPQEVEPPEPPTCDAMPKPPVPCRRCAKRPQQSKTESHSAPAGSSIGSFLRQLLPRNFDTGDLLVVVLLLLMSCDCSDDQNTALLTLALYLFM